MVLWRFACPTDMHAVLVERSFQVLSLLPHLPLEIATWKNFESFLVTFSALETSGSYIFRPLVNSINV